MFKYIKKEYQSIYEWMSSNKEASCFYCEKPRDADEMEVTFFAQGHVGICKICFPEFRIGNLAADRHVVERILSKYNRKVDVLNWFRRNGYELEEQDSNGEYTAYNFVNNQELYERHMKRIQNARGPIHTDDDVMEELFSYTRIEISKDGNVHIVY
jgi:hypothetical protein